MYLGILPEEWLIRCREEGVILPTEKSYVKVDTFGRAMYRSGDLIMITFTRQTFNQFKRSGDFDGFVTDWQLLYAQHKWCSILDKPFHMRITHL